MMSQPPQSDRDDHACIADKPGYLWDRTGAADWSIARLETALAPLRYQPSDFRVSAHLAPSHAAMFASPHRAPLRAAAALAFLITGIWMIALLSTAARHGAHIQHGQLTVTSVAGAPQVASALVRGSVMFRAGEWLETNEQSQAEIAVGGLGTVLVEPGTRLRLVHARENEQRLDLARGSIVATITAPPRLFVVDTPAATAVDLGCAYRLSVDNAGDGIIEVTGGWVSMEGSGGEASIVPRGGVCLTRKGRGAGTPFYADASAALIRALRAWDFESGGEAVLATVLAEARERDSLTLWHLLSRTHGADRAMVHDRLAALSPPPDTVTKTAILRGDAPALQVWRDAFIWSPNPPTSPAR